MDEASAGYRFVDWTYEIKAHIACFYSKRTYFDCKIWLKMTLNRVGFWYNMNIIHLYWGKISAIQRNMSNFYKRINMVTDNRTFFSRREDMEEGL